MPSEQAKPGSSNQWNTSAQKSNNVTEPEREWSGKAKPKSKAAAKKKASSPKSKPKTSSSSPQKMADMVEWNPDGTATKQMSANNGHYDDWNDYSYYENNPHEWQEEWGADQEYWEEIPQAYNSNDGWDWNANEKTAVPKSAVKKS